MAINLGLVRMFREALAEVKRNPIIDSAIRLTGAVEVDPECFRDELIEAFRQEPYLSPAREAIAMVIVEHFMEKDAVEALLHDFDWEEGCMKKLEYFGEYCEIYGNPFPINPNIELFKQAYAAFKKHPSPDAVEAVRAVLAKDHEELRPLAVGSLWREDVREHQLMMSKMISEVYDEEILPLAETFKEVCLDFRAEPDEGSIMVVQSIFDKYPNVLYPLMLEEIEKDQGPTDEKELLATMLIDHFPHKKVIEMMLEQYDWEEEDFQDIAGFDKYCEQHGTPYSKAERERYFLELYKRHKKYPRDEVPPFFRIAVKRDPESVRDILMKTLKEETDEVVRASLAKLAAEFYGEGA